MAEQARRLEAPRKMKLNIVHTFSFLLMTGMTALCASCGSSRTGFLKTATGTHTQTASITGRTVDKSLLRDFSFLRSDSLYMRITEYYPPPEGDTTQTGPVKSETTIRYGATTAADSSAALTEQETENATTLEDTTVSHREESRTKVKTTPWYAGWQIILISVITVAFIIYCILRRAHFI
jgi:hypothetical protein